MLSIEMRPSFDLQLAQYDDRGWRATFYTTAIEHSADERDGHPVGADAAVCDAARGVGGVEDCPGWLVPEGLSVLVAVRTPGRAAGDPQFAQVSGDLVDGSP